MPSDLTSFGLVHITAEDGFFYAVDRDGAVYRRPITHERAGWEHLIDGRPLLALSSHDGELFGVRGAQRRVLSRPAGMSAARWQGLPHHSWRHPLTTYRLDDSIPVRFGNDFTERSDPLRVRRYLHAGEADAAILLLPNAVPASTAEPIPSLVETPSPDPSAFWSRQVFEVAGWGRLISRGRRKRLLRRTGSSWTEIGTSPGSTIDLAEDRRGAYALVRDGTIFRRGASGEYDERLTQLDSLIGITAVGDRLLAASEETVMAYDIAADHFTGWDTPLLAAGEVITAITTRWFRAGAGGVGREVHVATSSGRILARFYASGAWFSPSDPLDPGDFFISMAAPGSTRTASPTRGGSISGFGFPTTDGWRSTTSRTSAVSQRSAGSAPPIPASRATARRA